MNKIFKALTISILITLSILVIGTYCSTYNNNNNNNNNRPTLHCSNRISDPNHIFHINDINHMCDQIHRNSDLIMLRLVDNVPGQYGKGPDHVYDKDSSDYFDHNCNLASMSGVCQDGILVTVYHQARKIRITTGSYLTPIIPFDKKKAIISKMGGFLKRDNFPGAFFTAIDEINYYISMNKSYNHSSYYSNNYRDNNNYNYDYNTYNDYRRNDYGYNSHNRNRYNNNKSNYNDGDYTGIIIIVVIFAFIFVIFYFSNSNSKDNKQAIHNHFEKLNEIIKKQIITHSPPIATVNCCLISMEPLNNTTNNNNKDKKKKEIIQYSCGHYYHKESILGKPITQCIMCNDITQEVPFDNNNTDNMEYSNHVTEKQLLNIMKNFDIIYKKETLKNYYQSYSSDVKIMKECNTINWVNDSYYSYVEPTRTNRTHYSSRSNYSSGNRSSYNNTSTSGGDYDDYSNSGSNDKDTAGGDY